jgi:hypothetical protein
MASHYRPYGVGIAYRSEVHPQMMASRAYLDMLEIAAVDYTVRGWRLLNDPDESLLQEAVATFPSAMHATTFSLGSVEPFDEGDLKRTFDLMDRCGIVSFSEHLAFHRLDGTDLHSFLPMPFDEVSLDWVTRKYNALRSRVSRPIALENVSYLVNIPECEMDEATFLTELTRRTDCMLLLDVTNVFNNAHNHAYDPVEFIRKLPGDRIEQLHIAGGHQSDGTWMDSHSAPVMEGVWPLLEEALKHTAADVVILEKDMELMPYGLIARDLKLAGQIFYKHRPKKVPDGPPASDKVAPVNARVLPIEPDDPKFADLRNFQLAMIRVILDKPFRKEFIARPSLVQQEYPMASTWMERLAACGRRHYDMLHKKWHNHGQMERDRDERVRRMEWAAWAGV